MIVNGLNSAYGVNAVKVAGEAFKVENAQLKYWLVMGDNPVAERLEKSANATPTNAHVRSLVKMISESTDLYYHLHHHLF